MRGLAIFSEFATVQPKPTDNLSTRALPTPRFPGSSPGASRLEDRRYANEEGQCVRQVLVDAVTSEIDFGVGPSTYVSDSRLHRRLKICYEREPLFEIICRLAYMLV